MASILFSTIGQAVGGPLGAAVGAAVGGTIDGAVFGRGSAGPGDLLIQRSAYGEVLPRLYGVSRQAGVVVWALPLSRSGGGKGSGRPAYVSSFAIAVSSRPILGIGRIWADGREIRNAAGEFETETVFRVHSGARGAAADSAVVAAEGAAWAPAYSGTAYVVFEDFSLAAFGNRIPNLSFEVVADAAGSTAGDWLKDLGGAAAILVDPAGGSDDVLGYSASGYQWAGDMEALARAADVSEQYAAGELAFRGSGRLFEVPESELCPVGAVGLAASGRKTMALSDRPVGLTLGYFDPERDYQAGNQSALRRRTGRTLATQAPFTATASMARGLANRYLRHAEAAAEMIEIGLGWRWLDVSVGDSLSLGGQPELWRVVRRDIEGMIVRLECQKLPSGAADGARPSSCGRALGAPVVAAGATELDVFELPMAFDGRGGQGFWVSASGGRGWRGADVGWSWRDGDLAEMGFVYHPAVCGELLQPLGGATAQLWDTVSEIELMLDHDDDWLESRTDSAVLSGANLLRVGNELLQFRAAEAMGSRRFRLSGLLRARFGTGLAGGAHAIGTRVERVDSNRWLFQPFGSDRIGHSIQVRAWGPGDAAGGAAVDHMCAGAGSAPLAPCHVVVFRRSNGELEASWIQRDRRFFDWANAVESTPDRFLCRFVANISGQAASVEKRVLGLRLTYSLADQIVDFGEPLRQFSLVVLSEGEGPESIRSAQMVEFAVPA